MSHIRRPVTEGAKAKQTYSELANAPDAYAGYQTANSPDPGLGQTQELRNAPTYGQGPTPDYTSRLPNAPDSYNNQYRDRLANAPDPLVGYQTRLPNAPDRVQDFSAKPPDAPEPATPRMMQPPPPPPETPEYHADRPPEPEASHSYGGMQRHQIPTASQTIHSTHWY